MDTKEIDQKTDAVNPPVREMAQELYFGLLLDFWPSMAAIVDFGIATQEHYGALQFEAKRERITMEQLDDAMGNGPALTALIQPDNPYHGVTFQTAWDDIMVSIKEWADAGPAGKFPLGRLFATPAVLKVVPKQEINEALRRHAAGDWGNMPPEEKEQNNRAVLKGDLIVSTYRTESGGFFEVTTDASRSTTVVHLHSEA